MLKKILIGFLVLIVLLLGAMVIIPIVFKDDIQAALDEQLDANLNAKFFYDTDAFSLSLFKSFPNLTVSIGNFGIAGIEEFEGDTLTSIGNFQLTVDLMSAISGEKIVVNNILLDQPNINVIVLPNGKANYDVAKSSGETDEPEVEEAESSESADFSLAIKKWEIRDGSLSYDDRSSNMFATLKGLNHEGTGDFSLEILDLSTATRIDEVSFGYGGVSYLYKKTFSADLILNMDLPNMKFTFKENKIALSAFGFGFDGFVSMPGENIEMDITFVGQEMDLKGLLSLIPGAYQEYLNGINAGGQIGFDGFVKGVYNETTMPQVAANLSVDNGAITYAEYPVPIEDLTIKAGFDYPSANLKDFTFNVETFSMLVDGEKTTASLTFKDLEDYFWNFKFDGNLDIGKLTKIIPLEGMDLEGKLNATLQTSGRMSDVEAERYQNLPTSGSMSLADFKYTSPDLPQGFGIQNTEARFNPEAIVLSNFKGNAGKTDLNMSGEIRNYMEYALGEDANLVGRFDFASAFVDINEWMVAEDTTAYVEEEDTTTLEVVRIPTDIDFILNSAIDKMIYDNLSIDQFAGRVLIQEGGLHLEKVNFQLLGGYFEMNGGYETLPEDPLYEFDFKIEKLSIPESYQAFSTIQQMAPFAEKMTGNFSSEFEIQGSLLQDMSPDYNTMQGFGLVNVADGALNNVEILSKVSGFTGGNAFGDNEGTVTLKDVLMQAEIKDGRVFVKPFEMKIGKYTTAVEGSNGIAGDLDYALTVLDVSTGALGQAASSLISSTLGVNNAVASSLDFNLGVTGTFDDPKVKFLGAKPSSGGQSSSAKAAIAAKAKAELQRAKKRAKQEALRKQRQAKELANQKKQEAQKKLDSEKAKVTTKVNAATKSATNEIKKAVPSNEVDKAKDKLKGAFGKKKKDGN